MPASSLVYLVPLGVATLSLSHLLSKLQQRHFGYNYARDDTIHYIYAHIAELIAGMFLYTANSQTPVE